MKLLQLSRVFTLSALALCMASTANAKSKKDKKDTKSVTIDLNIPLETKADSVAYFLGSNIGRGFQEMIDTYPIDVDVFIASIATELKTEEEPRISDADGERVMMEFVDEEAKLIENEVRKEQEAFLEKNKKEKDIQCTESGLQYKIDQMGNGMKPVSNDNVRVHYEGTLIDGTVFDSSYDRNKPLDTNLASVIEAWTEGIQLMPVGSIFTFYVPSELGYGDKKSGKIEGHSTLIFKIHLIDIL